MAWQYYISAGGTDTELSGVNGHSLAVSRRSAAVSTASWTVDVQPENAPLWPYGTQIAVLRKDGATVETLFQGKITNDQPDAEADDESIPYQASDAWWDFEGEVYRQSRKIALLDGMLHDALYGRALLGRAAGGTRLSAAQIISAAVAYGAAIGIQIQSGTIDAPVTPPWFEVVAQTLAEIVRVALLFQPDAVPWIDHTTTPPTLHVTRRASMTAETLAYAGLGKCRVRAFPEQQISGCEITYELSNARGRTVSVDSAGSTTALRCARFTIPLEFLSGSTGPVEEIKVVALGDYTALSWWQTMFPWLPDDAEITEATIMPTPADGFDKILVSGQITSWMQDELDLDAGEYTVSCNAGATVDGRTFVEKTLQRRFKLTNAVSKRYIGRFQQSWTEPVPTGVAAAFYAAMSALQYGGTVRIEEEECTAGRTLMGKALNVSGARAAWATMRAAVIGVDEDFDAGSTQVTLGPARHLAPQDMVDLLRASRWRHRAAPQNPDDGGVAAPAEDEVDPFEPEDTSAESPGKLSALVLTDEDVGSINIDAADLDEGEAIEVRECTFTDTDGDPQTVKIMATAAMSIGGGGSGLPTGTSDHMLLRWNATNSAWEQIGGYEERDVVLYARDGILTGTILFKPAESGSYVNYDSGDHRKLLQVVDSGGSQDPQLLLDHGHLADGGT